jgi:hypothetical protein
MDLGAVVRHYRMNHARNSEAELDSFRREATLSAAVARAATAETGLLDHEIFATVSSGLDAGAKEPRGAFGGDGKVSPPASRSAGPPIDTSRNESTPSTLQEVLAYLDTKAHQGPITRELWQPLLWRARLEEGDVDDVLNRLRDLNVGIKRSLRSEWKCFHEKQLRAERDVARRLSARLHGRGGRSSLTSGRTRSLSSPPRRMR